MKAFKLIYLVLIYVYIQSCSTISVMVDYDKKNDFNTYKKYRWVKQKNVDDYQSIYKNEINRKRFALAVEKVLSKKGFERTDGSEYDFSVVYYLRFDKKIDISSYGYRYWPRTGLQERYIQTKVYQQGSIIFDVIDAKEKQLVWRGAAEEVLLETDDPESVINETVKAILKDFPPKRKK